MGCSLLRMVSTGVRTQVCDHTVSEAVWMDQLCFYSGNTQLIRNTRSTFHIVTECSAGGGSLEKQSQVGLQPFSMFTDRRAQALISFVHSLGCLPWPAQAGMYRLHMQTAAVKQQVRWNSLSDAKDNIFWLICHIKKLGIVQMLVLLCFGLHCTCCQTYMFDTIYNRGLFVFKSVCNEASVHMLYSSGDRRGGCWNCFAALQLLLPWTLRAAGGGRRQVKRHYGMPLALCVRNTAAVLRTLLSTGDVLIMCLIPIFNPNASQLLPSPGINKVFLP